MPSLTPHLRDEYQRMYDQLAVTAARAAEVDQLVNRLLANRSRYEAVAGRLGMPWQIVAVIHNMEASQRFDRHLHNGDPLTARTVRVPAGRPQAGSPPFSWEESATDALKLKGMQNWADWSVPGALFKLEEYNGWGYRKHHPQVKTPYLWSFCQHYTRGKYVADGSWSDTAVSAQCGSAVLLHRLAGQGHPLPPPPARQPLPDRFAAVRYAPAQHVPLAAELQAWLNGRLGTALVVDGKAGRGTSDAVLRLAGHFLPGDPRAA